MVSLLTHVCVIRPQWVNHTGPDLVSLIVLNLTSLTSADSDVINNTEPHVNNNIEPGVIYITKLDGINGDVPEVIKILNWKWSRCETIFDPLDILTTGSKYHNDVFIPLQYFNTHPNNRSQSFICLINRRRYVIIHCITFILMISYQDLSQIDPTGASKYHGFFFHTHTPQQSITRFYLPFMFAW